MDISAEPAFDEWVKGLNLINKNKPNLNVCAEWGEEKKRHGGVGYKRGLSAL